MNIMNSVSKSISPMNVPLNINHIKNKYNDIEIDIYVNFSTIIFETGAVKLKIEESVRAISNINNELNFLLKTTIEDDLKHKAEIIILKDKIFRLRKKFILVHDIGRFNYLLKSKRKNCLF